MLQMKIFKQLQARGGIEGDVNDCKLGRRRCDPGKRALRVLRLTANLQIFLLVN